MPILNSEIRSYNIIFTGKKERLIQSLQENNLTQYIFLNDLLIILLALLILLSIWIFDILSSLAIPL